VVSEKKVKSKKWSVVSRSRSLSGRLTVVISVVKLFATDYGILGIDSQSSLEKQVTTNVDEGTMNYEQRT
jgi:hypothetical protein